MSDNVTPRSLCSRNYSMYKDGASQGALVVKNPFASAGDIKNAGLIPGLGRFPETGNGNPLQYPCLGNPMGRGAWWATIPGVAKCTTEAT